jgi:hypothetical protein
MSDVFIPWWITSNPDLNRRRLASIEAPVAAPTVGAVSAAPVPADPDALHQLLAATYQLNALRQQVQIDAMARQKAAAADAAEIASLRTQVASLPDLQGRLTETLSANATLEKRVAAFSAAAMHPPAQATSDTAPLSDRTKVTGPVAAQSGGASAPPAGLPLPGAPPEPSRTGPKFPEPTASPAPTPTEETH